MSRKTTKVSGGDTGRIEQYNDLRTEARKSSQFTPFQQAVPDLTLFVNEGKVFFGETLKEFAGGNSPEFTAPITNPRIDLLTLTSAGALKRTAGSEAASPSAPAIPLDEYPICYVYNRVDQTSIKEEDDSTNGYIQKDLRAEVGNLKDVGKDSEMVKLTGNQTIEGIKTFGSIPVLPAANPTTDNQASRKKYIDELDAQNVKITGNQTVAGIKTFSSIPVLPASDPTTDNQATRKVYVDAGPTTKSGITTRTKDAASGDQTIAHGLGRTPKFVRISAFSNLSSGEGSRPIISHGSYDGSQKCIYYTAYTSTLTTDYIIYLVDGGPSGQRATISVDATNITLSWTKISGGLPFDAKILWEAY